MIILGDVVWDAVELGCIIKNIKKLDDGRMDAELLYRQHWM